MKSKKKLVQYEIASGHKINMNKTQIISNDSETKECLAVTNWQNNLQQTTKILGIHFSLEVDTTAQNWVKAVNTIRYILHVNKPRNLTLNGKTLLINTLIVPQLLHTGKHISLPLKYENILTQLMFQFVWAPSKIENIKRATLQLPKSKGGKGVPIIKLKIISAQLSRFYEISRLEKITELWHEWTRHQLGSSIKIINPSLFTNTAPNTISPNTQYAILRHYLYKLDKSNFTWETDKLKLIYEQLQNLQTTENVIILNGKILPWENINCATKYLKPFFTNYEINKNYLIANKAFRFGDFRKSYASNYYKGKVEIRNCKFCRAPEDNITHILLKCPTVQKLFQQVCKFANTIFTYDTYPSEKLIMYNIPNGNKMIGAIKLITITKVEVLDTKRKLDKDNEYLWDNKEFNKRKLWIIKNKFGIYLSKLKDALPLDELKVKFELKKHPQQGL